MESIMMFWKRLNKKKLIIVALAALAARFVLLEPLSFLWDGWLVVIAAVVASILAEYLHKLL